MQQPHPPVWIPGGGSIETWGWCVENDFLYAYLSYFGYKRARAMMESFWEEVDKRGAEQELLDALEKATRIFQSTLRSRRIIERLQRRRLEAV